MCSHHTSGNKRGRDGDIVCHPDGTVPANDIPELELVSRWNLRPTQQADIAAKIAAGYAMEQGLRLARIVLAGGCTDSAVTEARKLLERVARAEYLRELHSERLMEAVAGHDLGSDTGE